MATRTRDAGGLPEAAYLALHRSGELKRRAGVLRAMMGECRLCPRECGANRLQGEAGFCRAPGARLVVSSAQAHFGEEEPLVGRHGSGTVFFSHCNLRCCFCQNWEVSMEGEGSECGAGDLAAMMLGLQGQGCHNVNLVTPTHYAAHILEALDLAAGQGLRVPVVYNTSGWERLEVLKLLDGVVDIYMPDFKYRDGVMAAKLSSGARSYPETTAAAILEMRRQVGDARFTPDGVMLRGLIVRHLVMPNDAAGSGGIMEWIARNLPCDTYVNIMSQYHPAGKARDHPEIARRVSAGEYRAVVGKAMELGLTNLDIQGVWLALAYPAGADGA